jgi:hypothetical protein
MRCLLSFALAAAAMATCGSASAASRLPVNLPLFDCAISEAVRLEPSGEPADVVAEAAVGSSACTEHLGYRSGMFGPEGYDAARIYARDKALSAVIEIRLKRKAAGN